MSVCDPFDDAGVSRNVVIFDGECGFCAWSLRTFARITRLTGTTFVMHQRVGRETLEALGTTQEECSRAVHLWDSRERRLYRGADAFNRLAMCTRLGRGPARVLARVKPMLELERRAYAFVASHRSLISAVLGTRRFAPIPTDNSVSADRHKRRGH